MVNSGSAETYDPAKWKRAADANRELIEAAHAAGHDLVREYNADGSIDPFMSCYNVLFPARRSESGSSVHPFRL